MKTRLAATGQLLIYFCFHCAVNVMALLETTISLFVFTYGSVEFERMRLCCSARRTVSSKWVYFPVGPLSVPTISFSGKAF